MSQTDILKVPGFLRWPERSCLLLVNSSAPFRLTCRRNCSVRSVTETAQKMQISSTSRILY